MLTEFFGKRTDIANPMASTITAIIQHTLLSGPDGLRTEKYLLTSKPAHLRVKCFLIGPLN